MLRIVLAILLFSSTTPTAAACKLHKVWKYPWPQRCSAEKKLPDIVIHPMLIDLEAERRQEAIDQLKILLAK